MSEKKPRAAAPRKLRLEETVLAIDLFLNHGVSAKDSIEAALPPEGGLRFDGETWAHKGNTSG